MRVEASISYFKNTFGGSQKNKEQKACDGSTQKNEKTTLLD